MKSGIRDTFLVDITPLSVGERENYFVNSCLDKYELKYAEWLVYLKVAFTVRLHCKIGDDMIQDVNLLEIKLRNVALVYRNIPCVSKNK